VVRCNGHGKFPHVRKIEDVFGSYASIGGDVGLKEARTAQALRKGDVSLTLTGTGSGIDSGVSITEFRIERAPAAAPVTLKPAASKSTKAMRLG